MMPGDSLPSPDRPSHEPQHEPPGPYARLARRMAGWTSNLLVTAMLIVLGLAAGRQLVESYRAEPAKVDAGAKRDFAPGLAEPGVLQFVEFGDGAAAMGRQELTGDTADASKALRAIARELAAHASPPNTPITATERQTLQSLAAHKPVDAGADWALYEMKPGYPMLLGVRRAAAAACRPADPARQAEPAAQRVVLSAVGVPAGEKQWILYTFGQARARAHHSSNVPDVPLPPGASQRLAVRSPAGAAMVSFKGASDAALGMKFYDDWFSARQWVATGGWVANGSARHARFSPRENGSRGAVDVRFDGDGTGLLVITP